MSTDPAAADVTSHAYNFSKSVLDQILKKFNATEEKNETLEARGSPVGWVRIYKSDKIHIVNIGLVLAIAQLDSHMIFAFTNNSCPHFTLDFVKGGPHYAYHLDLIPKTDIAVDIDYINKVYTPIEEPFNQSKKIEGAEPAQISTSQVAIMSPWMIVNRATEDATKSFGALVQKYLDHWFNLTEDSYFNTHPIDSVRERDIKHRAVLFSYVDPVWHKVDRMLGQEKSAELREHLKKLAY